MKITLNLATRPYADQGPAIKRLRIGMAVMVVLLAGLAYGWLHFHQRALAMAKQEADLDHRVSSIRAEQAGYQRQMQLPDNAKVLTQAGFLNGLFDEKAFSWTAAMEDLEQVLPAGVQVTAIEPVRGKDGRLTLRLRISGLRERSVDMVRNMERSRRFVAPRISGETAENSSSQGDLQPVRDNGPAKVSFEILAEYNPATLEERKTELAGQKKKHAEVGGTGQAAPLLPGGQRMPYRPNGAPSRLPRSTQPGNPLGNRPMGGPIPGSIPGRLPNGMMPQRPMAKTGVQQ